MRGYRAHHPVGDPFSLLFVVIIRPVEHQGSRRGSCHRWRTIVRPDGNGLRLADNTGCSLIAAGADQDLAEIMVQSPGLTRRCRRGRKPVGA
ncbi:MAG: hypothetical protein KDI35_13895 [Gammaproteobacteria bacterium]|nr:hypothetical protein [Gammaproteobacteria bacterium]